MERSILDDWETSQKPIEFKPDFRESIEIEIENIAPCHKETEFVKFINDQAKRNHPQQAFYEYDEDHRMFGHYSNARIIKEKVWVTFTPVKTAGMWISWHKYKGL